MLVGGQCGRRAGNAVVVPATPLSNGNLQLYGPCLVCELRRCFRWRVAHRLRSLRRWEVPLQPNTVERLASPPSGWTRATAPLLADALSSINDGPLVFTVSRLPCWSLVMPCDARGNRHRFTPRADGGKYFVYTAAEQEIPGLDYPNPFGASMRRGGYRA